MGVAVHDTLHDAPPAGRHGQALTPLESGFLHIESTRTPMHMGSVVIFEGAELRDASGSLRLDDLRAYIAGRLDRVPKLRRKVRPPAIFGAPSVLVDDEDFDITSHVRAIGVPAPGGEPELLEVCGNLMSEPLDRTRPLWDMWLVDGLADGRVALLVKLHHAMADGLGGVEVATVLFDTEPRPFHPPSAPAPWHPEPPPGALQELGDDVGRFGEIVRRWAGDGVSAVCHPLRTAGRAARLTRAVAALSSLRVPGPRLSINPRIGTGRRLLVVRQPIEDLRRVEHTYGTTLNDVVLCAVAGGIGVLLEDRRRRAGDAAPRGSPEAGAARSDPSAAGEIQVLVPVGFAHPGGQVDNRVAALFARLPMGGDPLARLHAVSGRMQVAKLLHEELASELFLDLLAPLPQPLLAAAAQLVHHQALINLVVTNMPGPPVPLYVLGARALETFPFVPLAGNLSLGVAAMSYEGQLTLGILADHDTCSDAPVFVEGVERSFAQLVALVPRRASRAASRRRSPGH
ncbi:MAG TPA: wax ester/triacylglycerol synthase domain-containing protein [Acidimicrobiales bacterium]|nr:wax ester/triacylglycerol synthase domain-containing protein [Acidimicrobiales bacterium]